jgi:two-component system sensor histidine kinase CpxA
MKTPFPLFARLLLWFFINLLVLAAGLLLMVRMEFGSLDNWLLPQSSQDQIQAMSQTLIGNLAHSQRPDWGGALAQLSSAYKMDFALFDSRGNWIDGAKLDPPDEIRHAMMFAQPIHASVPPGPGMTPPGGPPEFNPLPGGPSAAGFPPEGAPPDGPPPAPPKGVRVPDFPKSVLHSRSPSGYWLLVRLPPEPLRMDSQITLVGMTPALGISPLLFNPKPWIAVAIGIVVFSILFWLPMARNLTRSITKMTRATEKIAEGQFDIQLADDRTDELGRLGHAINRMAGRLKDFVTGQKRFLGDAAHELCSPLARMEIALGILEERGDEKSQPYVRDVREEVTHMRKLANELLSFSKSALLEHQVALAPVNLADVVDAAIRQEKSGAFPIEVSVPKNLTVQGHFDLLQRALGNLLRNALRHGGDQGLISVRGWAERGQVFVSVADEGPGLDPKELEQVFDPFYRVDPSRAVATGGAGLGLAIVKSCVESCGGVVSAANREPHGLEVKIRLDHAEANANGA